MKSWVVMVYSTLYEHSRMLHEYFANFSMQDTIVNVMLMCCYVCPQVSVPFIQGN